MTAGAKRLKWRSALPSARHAPALRGSSVVICSSSPAARFHFPARISMTAWLMVGRCAAASVSAQAPSPTMIIAHHLPHRNDVDTVPLNCRLLLERNSHGSGGAPSWMLHLLRISPAGSTAQFRRSCDTHRLTNRYGLHREHFDIQRLHIRKLHPCVFLITSPNAVCHSWSSTTLQASRRAFRAPRSWHRTLLPARFDM